MQSATTEKVESAALKEVQGMARHNMAPAKWRDKLHFTPDHGTSKLFATCGWILGIQMAGKEDLATHLAESLVKNLDCLADYGGEEEVSEWEGKKLSRGIRFPRFRVILGGSSYLGEFGIAWFRVMGVTDQPSIPEKSETELRLDRFVRQGEDKDWLTLYANYTYSFNGGLILHGAGYETFSVEIGGGSGPHWSVHT